MEWEEKPALVLSAGSQASAPLSYGARHNPALSFNVLSLQGVIKSVIKASVCDGLLELSW